MTIPDAELAARQAVAEAANGATCGPVMSEEYRAFDAAFSPSTAIRLIAAHREMAERVRVLEEALKAAATSVDKIAFEMRAPNQYTPRFAMVAVGMRSAALQGAAP